MIGRGVAQPVERLPELRGAALIGGVAQQVAAFAVFDFVEELAAELEIVALLIDAPASGADNVNAISIPANRSSSEQLFGFGASEIFGMRWIGKAVGLSA